MRVFEALPTVFKLLPGSLLAAALAVAAPAFGQSLEPAADARPVLPVWSTASGRVEALLLVDQADITPQFHSSSLRSLFDGMSTLRGRTSLGHGLRLDADLALGQTPALGLLCDGNIGIAAALGRLGDQCLLARLDRDNGRPEGLQYGFALSGGWSNERDDVDLSFGLSWLDSSLPTDPLSPLGTLSDTPLELAGTPLRLQQRELVLQGSHALGPRSWLRVDGRRGQTQLLGNDPLRALGLPNGWDSTSVSVSGGYGPFSGSITGKLIEVDQSRSRWTDIDVSVSWRTPWDARVSIGAKNLLGSGEKAEEWPLNTLPGLTDSEARTPYVRYHQDL